MVFTLRRLGPPSFLCFCLLLRKVHPHLAGVPAGCFLADSKSTPPLNSADSTVFFAPSFSSPSGGCNCIPPVVQAHVARGVHLLDRVVRRQVQGGVVGQHRTLLVGKFARIPG